MKTSNYLIYLFFLTFLFSCKNPTNKKGLEIIGYRYNNSAETEELIFKLNREDIICVDWKNQSYKLRDSAISKIKESKFTGGYINEFIKLLYNDSVISVVNVLNSYSSNHKYFKDSPFTCVYESTNNIITKDNWFVINFYGEKKQGYYESLFNSDLFIYLHKNNLLTASQWKCDQQVGNEIKNKPNLNFDIDFCKRFCGDGIVSSNINFLCRSSQCHAFVDSLTNKNIIEQ